MVALVQTEVPSAEQVFREYAPRIERIAWSMLGNRADAEDVTQEVLLRILRVAPSFRGDAGFWTWLYRVTVNAALAFRRQREVRRKHHTAGSPDAQQEGGLTLTGLPSRVESPDQQALDREAREQIARAIAGLPEAVREVVVLADVKELPRAEIAGRLGLSLPALKSRLHRAHLQLRRALAGYFEEQVERTGDGTTRRPRRESPALAGASNFREGEQAGPNPGAAVAADR